MSQPETDIRSSSLYSEDLAPIPMHKRTWNTWNYAALWISMSLCIPTYMLASSLIGGGMNWWEAILTIFIGNTVVLIPMILNGHAGAKYGIPFPVFARASFGVRGANIPAMLRAIVACGWFGIQTWIGGFAIYQMMKLWIPSLATLPASSISGICLSYIACTISSIVPSPSVFGRDICIKPDLIILGIVYRLVFNVIFSRKEE